MMHASYSRMLQRSLYGELNEIEQHALDEHLRTCAECRHELDQLRRLSVIANQRHRVIPDPSLLTEARQQFFTALLSETHACSITARVRDVIWPTHASLLRPAFAGLTLVAIGAFIGTFAFPTHGPQPASTVLAPEAEITNVRFVNPDARDGVVEFTYDAVTRKHMRGSIDEESIQKVLAHALVNEQNPGTRMRSVSAIAARTIGAPVVDPGVKQALISALKADPNPGVRREALRVLRTFSFDDAVKESFLYVLMHDENPGLRVAAINGLDSAWVGGHTTDEELLNVLRNRMQSDENNYVRLRARAVLEEKRIQ